MKITRLTMIFFEPEQLVDEFLFKFKRRMARSDNDYLIRCGFSLQNVQPSPEDIDQPLTATRYWSTDPISTKSFNDFVLFHIRDTILKRVIVTGLTGSSWRFRRFNYINIKITTSTDLKLNW